MSNNNTEMKDDIEENCTDSKNLNQQNNNDENNKEPSNKEDSVDVKKDISNIPIDFISAILMIIGIILIVKGVYIGKKIFTIGLFVGLFLNILEILYIKKPDKK